MDDSQWTQWPSSVLAHVDDVLALVAVLGLLGLRVLPSSRRWAPRGNIRSARPAAAAPVGETASASRRSRAGTT